MKLELTALIALAASPILASGRPSLHTRPFGVSASPPPSRSQLTNDILAIRGGAVHESSTMSDLDGRIQSAALQNKLTVIDFTATW